MVKDCLLMTFQHSDYPLTFYPIFGLDSQHLKNNTNKR